ncbi:MAG: peptidoglycan-binding protein [Acidimicrobiia bacterium]|nr:peptidoglycan-binding protein [Acidimicrobiia bacterium]
MTAIRLVPRRVGAILLALATVISLVLVPHTDARAASTADVTTDELANAGTVLREGSRGELVVDLQATLAHLGYDVGPADGIFGPLTGVAVRQFQTDAGILVDGVVGTGTIAALAAALAENPPPAGGDTGGDAPSDDAPTIDPGLKVGDSGPAVVVVQVSLNDLGYGAGPADGIFGPKTETAVRAFQSDQGLDVTGIVDDHTASTLEEAASVPAGGDGTDQPTLRRGSRGDAVRLLQTLLNDLGYSAGTVDGVFGGQTASAVIRFQSDQGLAADAIVGPNTWTRLHEPDDVEVSNPPPPDPDCPPGAATALHPWRGEPCIERWRDLVEEYFETPEVDTALGIIRCESWGDPTAVNATSDTSGLFQHRPYIIDSFGRRKDLWNTRYGWAVDWWADRGVTIPAGGDIFDPETNVAVAAYLVYREPNAGGWWHWGTFYGTAGCHDWVVDVQN